MKAGATPPMRRAPAGRRPRLPCWLALLGVLAVPASHAAECTATLDGAERDWRRGDMKAVVARLRAHEAQCAAQARFDRVLGEALLADEQPAAALMPLERAVTLDPGDQSAWRALAQAWQQLGDPEAARRARQAMITPAYATPAGSTLHWQATLEGGIGHDSNATQAPYDSTVAVPALGNTLFTLNPASLQRAAGYHSTLLRTEGRWEWTPGSMLSLAAQQSKRLYIDLPLASSEDDTVGIRLERTGAAGTFALGVNGGRLSQGRDMARTAAGGSLEWRTSRAVPLMPVLGWSLTRYNSTHTGTDDDTFVEQMATVGSSFAVGRAVFGVTAIGGYDSAGTHHPDGNRSVLGARLQASGPLWGRMEWFAWMDRLLSRSSRQDPTFQTTRNDTLDDAGAGLAWAVGHGVSVRSTLTLAQQHSTIPLYVYHRADFNVVLAYEFGN